MNDVLLEMRSITKRFPGVKALEDVSLAVRRGEIHAICGENGAGKSTLMKIIAGIYAPDAGEFRLKGRPVVLPTPLAALQAGIAMIHQELNLMPFMTVAENIWIRREPLTRFGFGFVDHGELRRRTQTLFDRLAIEPAGDVRQELEPLRGADVADAYELGETRHQPVVLLADEREYGFFILSLDPAYEVYAPHLVLLFPEAELGQRNPDLRRPPEGIDGHGGLPHGVPGGVVEVPIRADQDVLPYAGGVHDELERGAAIVVAVEVYAELVAVRGRVAPGQPPHDLRGGAVEQVRTDVHRAFIVEDAYLGRL